MARLLTRSAKFVVCCLGCVLLLGLSGCMPAIAPGHPYPKNPYALQFEEYWYNFDRLYPYFDYKHVSWQALYNHYRPLADKVTSEAQLAILLSTMGAKLKDVHVWLRDPDDEYLNTYDPARAADPNWNSLVINKYVPDLEDFGGDDWGFGHIDGFGYIFINDWKKSALSLTDFRAVLSMLPSARGLILDVRSNYGGDEKLAYKVASYFAAHKHLSEYYRYRDGPLPGDLGPPVPKYLKPSSVFHYGAPVILLIGPDSFSSTENFIAAMQTLPQVTTIGAVTGGASGCPRTFHLADGWEYSVPVCYDMTANHRVIEWNGIKPEIPVAVSTADFKSGKDPILDKALELLRAKLKLSEHSTPVQKGKRAGRNK